MFSESRSLHVVRKTIIWPSSSCVFFSVSLSFFICFMCDTFPVSATLHDISSWLFSPPIYHMLVRLIWCHALMGGSGSALLSRKMSQEPCHTCPWGTSQQQCSHLYPLKNGRSGGNRARPTIWEKTPSTTSRGNLTLTSSSNTAMFLWIQPLHRPKSLGSAAGLGKVYFSCLRLSLK